MDQQSRLQHQHQHQHQQPYYVKNRNKSKTLSSLCALSLALLLSACSPASPPAVKTNDKSTTSQETQQTQAVLQVSSPDWRKQIIYFLMIDRFNDGDSSNNDQGTGEYDPSKESHFHGGDIAGITQQIDYIKNLGATSVWLTPPVKNLWWSDASNYGGYHGYWATNFKKIDEHFGTLQDYQHLSKQLHANNMYLIQDIVLNHTAPLFGYQPDNAEESSSPQQPSTAINPPFNPNATDHNFYLFPQAQPLDLQPPFDQFNRLNPAHAAANIYHWTPPIKDQNNSEQLLTYQLADLADINTSHPDVVNTFKQTYNYWIREAGVDAFRVDTAKYVEHDFWQRFFSDEDGIQAQAKALGKNEFLSFAEVFNFSEPFENQGEQKLQPFYGDHTSDSPRPEFNSVLGFPLYQEIERVFAEGKPTEQLAYRLQQHMQYRDPYRVVNFIDNHDVKRFLSAGSLASFKQALALIFTIPGIPAVYQGNEQAFTESRRAMFAAHNGKPNAFDPQSDMYRFIKALSALRLSDDAFTLGDMQIIKANNISAGELAFTRSVTPPNSNEIEHRLVVMNTASHRVLLSQLNLTHNKDIAQKIRQHGFPQLRTLFTESQGLISNKIDSKNAHNSAQQNPPSLITLSDRISLELPANSIAVYALDWQSNQQDPLTNVDLSDIVIEVDDNLNGEVFTQDVNLTGNITYDKTPLLAVVNGNLDTSHAVIIDETGRFDLTLPVRNLGEEKIHLQLYAPELGLVSEPQQFTASVKQPEWKAEVNDPNNDAVGPTKTYQSPTHKMSGMQREIIAASAQAAGANLTLSITMKDITEAWGPANGFDNVSFSVYFHLPEYERHTLSKAKPLPHINTEFPGGEEWSVGHILFGWGNALFHPNGLHPAEKGAQFGVSPTVVTNKASNTITIHYYGEQIGIRDWSNAQIYISTWDMTGEGYFRALAPNASNWSFGGGKSTAPKVMDDILLQLTPFSR